MKKIAAFLSAVLLVLVLSVQAQQPPATGNGKPPKPPKLKGVDTKGRREVDDTFKEKKAKKFRQHHRRHRRHKGE
jgi:hypothetical protein